MKNDLIKRQDAIDAINHICPIDTEYDCALLDRVDVRCVLSDLPSAEPERKKGKWIDEKINSYTSRTYCSECGSSAPFVYESDDYYGNHAHGETAKTKFCPNCGAEMSRGE